MLSSMDEDTDIHLTWNHHQTTLLSVFSSLLNNENLVDCTISAEGQHFKAHRMILSACSPYFELLFSEHYETNPIVILPGVEFQILKALLEYMYYGEIKVPQDKIRTVLDLADTLQIKGLSSVSVSEIKDDLQTKRRNESPIFCDQQGFRKHLREHTYGLQMKQKEDVSVVHISERCSENTDSLLFVTQRCDNSSTSISPEKSVEEPAEPEDITDSEAFNVFQCSSLTTTLIQSNTQVSGTLLNSSYNVLDSSQLPGPSTDAIGKHRMLNKNVLSTCSTSEEPRTSEPLGVNAEKRAVDLLPEIKQEAPDDVKGDSIEEIILDDDTDENDYDNASGVDNSNTVRGEVTPEESVSGHGFCNQEQYRYTYFVEPTSILPNQFKCDACGKSYRYYRGLWRHSKYECGKEPQFRCRHCPARFIHKHHLKEHIRRTHLPDFV